MSKRAEKAALKAYPVYGKWVGNQYGDWDNDINRTLRKAYLQGYEQAEKDTIERAIAWLKKHINDYIVKGRDIDLMFDDLRKAMEDEK